MSQAEVLVVDDSMSARFALTRALQPHGFNIATAKSGEEALETVAEQHYDIIFMDHVLPGISGLDAAEKIRAMPQFAQTPIVMCSSNDGEDYRAEAAQRGATDTIVKPPVEAELNRVLKAYIFDAPAPQAEPEVVEPTPPAMETAADSDSSTEAPITAETSSMSNENDKLDALDARLQRMESLLDRLDQQLQQMEARSASMAKVVADQAGRDLANRLLRAVITLKGK